MDKIYLPGLNGIRAIAASIVVVFHVDQYIKLFGVEALGFGNNGMAYFAVDMFFALSGYLITYLLLMEKRKFGTVDLKKFYMRRILRIWPLYYVTILITFLLFQIGLIEPNSKVLYTFGMFLIMLPNVAHAQGFDFITMFPLWSVGVEEQFYALWPLLVNKVKNILLFLTILIVGYLLISLGLKYTSHDNLKTLFHYASLDALGLGGITAYLVFKKHPLTKLIFHPLTQIACWLFLFVSLFYKPVHVFYYFDFAMHAGVYSILIANVSANPRTLISLENGILNFLGKISYGLYIYNMIVIFVAAYLLKDFILVIDNVVYKYLFIFGTSIGATVLISYISYHYFEVRFLRMKTKYSKIHSTNTTSEIETSEKIVSLQTIVQ